MPLKRKAIDAIIKLKKKTTAQIKLAIRRKVAREAKKLKDALK